MDVWLAPWCAEAGAWSWRVLELGELPIAWPLAQLFGAGPDLATWCAEVRAWLEEDARRQIGALLNACGVVVALARYEFAPRPDGTTLEVSWLAALQVTIEPRYHEALLRALAACARRAGCTRLRILRSGAAANALAVVARQLGLEDEPDGWRWLLAPKAPGSLSIQPILLHSGFARQSHDHGS